jgi:L,D-peptidoglycan transpeptidase YkuD (ErfK/YbiS/YcfS/YnhG family)
VRRWLAERQSAAAGISAQAAAPLRARVRRVETLLAEAERITAYEAAAGLRRSLGRVEEAWHRVARAAFEAERELASLRRTALERWAPLGERLRVGIDDAARLLESGGGLGYREARSLRTALFHRDNALAFAARGDFDRAIAAAEQALASSAQVEAAFAILHSRFSDPRRLREWRSWAAQTIAESRRSGEPALVVNKRGRTLQVYEGGRLVATFHAELGVNGLKEKHYAGDKATPEGRYKVTEERENGQTRYYKALMLDYPNPQDRARFERERRLGLIPRQAGLGGLIEIHGDGGTGKDWTDGCVALTNRDMDALFRWSRVGTPVTIVGAL